MLDLPRDGLRDLVGFCHRREMATDLVQLLQADFTLLEATGRTPSPVSQWADHGRNTCENHQVDHLYGIAYRE